MHFIYEQEDKENDANKTPYRDTSNITPNKSQKINVSRLELQLFLPNPLKPGVKPRMKM